MVAGTSFPKFIGKFVPATMFLAHQGCHRKLQPMTVTQ